MKKRLSPMDTVFLIMESPQNLMHVASMLTFQLPPQADRQAYCRQLMAHLVRHTHYAEPFDQKLAYPFLGMGAPSWVEDTQFDLENHVHHLAIPAPGGPRELTSLVARLHSTMLDRTRPLWEFHVIEGLKNNRFAIYFRIHHSCMDGLGRMKVIRSMLSTSADEGFKNAPWQGNGQRWKADPPQPLDTTLKNAFIGLANQLKIVPELASLGVSRSILHQSAAPMPFDAPKTRINKASKGQRRFAYADLPLSEVKQLGKMVGATVNDIVMSVCAMALRNYLLELNHLPDKPLIAFVPVSLRSNSHEGGNQLSNILCNLGTHIPDLRARLDLIKQSSSEGKEIIRKLSREAAQTLTFILQSPGMVFQLLKLSGVLNPAFNLMISNYPGPAEKLYLGSATLESLFPVSFLFNGQDLNITITSYVDALQFGLVGRSDGMFDMVRLASHIQHAFLAHKEEITHPLQNR
ncbi:MAG: wax ester/triacylglycerol synthase family O-acyltransferase [Rhodoferax sp.]|nr:wax ester/triacylglycerol synthase family O-acyltransferase [Rhodoferax sp.]